MATVGPTVLAGVALVAVWWAVASRTSAILVPSPQRVGAVFTGRPGYLAEHLWVTLGEIAQGYGLATAGGLVGGLLIAPWTVASRGLVPILFGLEAVPKLVFAPLLVVLLGFGQSTKVAMVTIMCLVTILYATITGLHATPAQAVDLARSLPAPAWRVFLKIRLPYALPRIFVGAKLAAPVAVIGAVLGEFVGASAGLGWVTWNAVGDTALLYAAAILLGVVSMALLGVVTLAERLAMPWARHAYH